MTHNDISDIANYQDCYTAHPSEIFSQYLGVMQEFISQTASSISISNINYFRHIVLKGIENITNVFRMLMLYTHNLDLTVYNTKKSIYYFLEFIGQIGDDNHDFLKLSSTDATMFVYKKTIFAVNQAYRKEHYDNDSAKTKCLFHMTELWLSAMRTSLATNIRITNDEVKMSLEAVSKYALAIIKIASKRFNIQDIIQNYEIMLAFNDAIKILPEHYHIDLLEAICYKVDKEKMDITLVTKAVFDNADKLAIMTLKKFVTNVVSNTIKQTEPVFS